ncbi:hypothetical protein [Methylocystis sp.]|uniref:hypothetical protein n=1 Tax=Methylocystis sp. TaxID=1911079 RepID=UPI003DA4CE62
MLTFNAKSDLVTIDTDNGKLTATTRIIYDFTELFEGEEPGNKPILAVGFRFIDTATQPGKEPRWNNLDYVAKSGARTKEERAAAKLKGTFESEPIKPGQLLQYMVEDTRPRAFILQQKNPTITIAGLLKHTDQNWTTDEGDFVGGTFYFRKIATGKETTFMRLQVGQGAPQLNEFNIPVFREPVATVASPFARSHDLEAGPLVPNNQYSAIVLLSNTKGQWTVSTKDFKTKQRRMFLQFTHLHIDNDGDPFDSSNAAFNIAVKFGNQTVTGGTFEWENDDINDEDSNKRDFVLPSDYWVVIGPDRLDDEGLPVTVEVSGTEEDGSWIFDWLEPDEHASNAANDRAIEYPTGLFREHIPHATRVFKATPDSGNFAFTITMEYSIEYVEL